MACRGVWRGMEGLVELKMTARNDNRMENMSYVVVELNVSN